MTINCTDCNTTFDPDEQGVIGGKVAFCGSCCEKPDETCRTCGFKVPHVDMIDGECDPCHYSLPEEG